MKSSMEPEHSISIKYLQGGLRLNVCHDLTLWALIYGEEVGEAQNRYLKLWHTFFMEL